MELLCRLIDDDPDLTCVRIVGNRWRWIQHSNAIRECVQAHGLACVFSATELTISRQQSVAPVISGRELFGRSQSMSHSGRGPR